MERGIGERDWEGVVRKVGGELRESEWYCRVEGFRELRRVNSFDYCCEVK